MQSKIMLSEIKKDLEKEISEISKRNDDYKIKQKILKANTNDSKFEKTIVIGLLSIVPAIIASANLITPIAGLSFPITTAICIASASSIAIGYGVQKIITSSSKKKMREFTDAETNTDILEEMMHYEIEIAKSKKRKEISEEMTKKFESFERFNDTFYPFLKYIDSFKQQNIYFDTFEMSKHQKLTLEELQKTHEILNKARNEKTEQLDILTSQKYLSEKFKAYRKTSYRINDNMINTFLISTPFTLLIGIPLAAELTGYASAETFADSIKHFGIIFSPILVTVPLTLSYFNKRSKDMVNVFNKLNQKLRENALSEKINIEYEKELNNMITTKICEIVELGIELKELDYVIEERSSETITESKDESKSKKDILFKDYPELHITEETRKDVLEHPARYSGNDARTSMGMFYTDEEKEKYIEESLSRPLLGEKERSSTLVKKRIPPKK